VERNLVKKIDLFCTKYTRMALVRNSDERERARERKLLLLSSSTPSNSHEGLQRWKIRSEASESSLYIHTPCELLKCIQDSINVVHAVS